MGGQPAGNNGTVGGRNRLPLEGADARRVASGKEDSGSGEKERNALSGGEETPVSGVGEASGGGAQQQPAQFSCDFGCGFHGGFDAVQEHEQTCRLRPWSSPATTDDAQSIRAWSEHAGRGDGQV